jgi:uncharacterized repeat protein (TIGR01451 family)
VVTNNGPSAAIDVVLVDTLPMRLLLQSASMQQGSGLIFADAFESGDEFVWFEIGDPFGFGCLVDGQNISCEMATLGSGTSATVTVRTIVDPLTPDATVITNSATVSSRTDDPNPGDESASTTFTVAAESTTLSILKTSAPNPVAQGGQLTYTLVVTNNGAAVATGVTLDDKFPFGFDNPAFVGEVPEGCLLGANVLACDFGILGVSAAVTVQVVGTVSSELALTNFASTVGNNVPGASVANTVTNIQ